MTTDLSLDRILAELQYCISLMLYLKLDIKQQSMLSIVSKTDHYHIYTIKILARKHVSTELMYPSNIAKRYIYINGSHQPANMPLVHMTQFILSIFPWYKIY
jgi:hypothetical protein